MRDRQILIHAESVAALAAGICDRREPEFGQVYEHMGAVLADAVLQAGLNYHNVVLPRVNALLNRFPDAKTTIAFKDVLVRVGAAAVLGWSHPEKPRRLFDLTHFLVANCVYTTSAFRAWLLIESSSEQLSSIRGIGPKTIDYLKKLCGIDAIAVDRHIRTFVSRAGVPHADYILVRRIVERAARLLSISNSELDRVIWNYESRRSNAYKGSRTRKLAIEA